MWIVYHDVYGNDYEARDVYLCKTDEDLAVLRMKFKKSFSDVYSEEMVVEVENFKQLIDNFDVAKLEKEFPEIKEALRDFIKACDEAVFDYAKQMSTLL